MSYEFCQNQLATTIRTLSNYDTNNLTLTDYRALQKGYTKVVVLRPGAFSRERTEFSGGMETTWNIVTELFIKYQDDTQVQNDIRDERQDIIDTVDKYPFLGTSGTASILYAIVSSGAEPTPVFAEDGSGPHFMLQELTCAVTEHTIVTESE